MNIFRTDYIEKTKDIDIKPVKPGIMKDQHNQ